MTPVIIENEKPWCTSWWHKVRYGSERTEDKFGAVDYVEYFCKKCGLKTDGFTHFKISGE